MENKIISTVKAWIPQCLESKEAVTEYLVLKEVANYCLRNFEGSKEEQQMAAEAMNVIGLLYYNGSLHVKNAIENEFLERMATCESPASLRKHISYLPKDLRPIYLKTILEN